ncbi:MAG: type II toxin-antitoxin system RelE/ParE family toxin [Desulfosporosinus sp.]|nr:type II toxin-antitoxin system RelE/ParE family toxin [Desulfosporosinus sp.]
MDLYSVHISELAESDLKEIGRYIVEELLEPTLALKLVDKIGDAALSLEEMPQRNALVADERLSTAGIRKLLVDNYIIYYIISEKEKTVMVIRILYGRRDWLALL